MITVKTTDKSILSSYLQKNRDIIDRHLQSLGGIPGEIPHTLYNSMHYSLSAGGKRVRPILAIASCEAVGGRLDDVIHAAIAIEMIHTYSLIHDDLPAMDNDDLRRGKPTNHKVFGEATAILAGDGLLTMAFAVLSDLTGADDNRLRIIHEIAVAAGPEGMVGGQQLDMENEGNNIDIKALEELHLRKTGALIRTAVRTGAIAGNATEVQLQSLTEYGAKTGLAFQIADDILDVEGDVGDVGKSIGKDAKQNKNTYPAVIGITESKILAEKLVKEALTALDSFDEKADPLRMIAEYIVERKN